MENKEKQSTSTEELGWGVKTFHHLLIYEILDDIKISLGRYIKTLKLSFQ